MTVSRCHSHHAVPGSRKRERGKPHKKPHKRANRTASVPRAIAVYARSAPARALSRSTLGRQRRNTRIRFFLAAANPSGYAGRNSGVPTGCVYWRQALVAPAIRGHQTLLCSARPRTCFPAAGCSWGRSTSPAPSRLRPPPLTHQPEIFSRHGRCQGAS